MKKRSYTLCRQFSVVVIWVNFRPNLITFHSIIWSHWGGNGPARFAVVDDACKRTTMAKIAHCQKHKNILILQNNLSYSINLLVQIGKRRLKQGIKKTPSTIWIELINVFPFYLAPSSGEIKHGTWIDHKVGLTVRQIHHKNHFYNYKTSMLIPFVKPCII